MNKDRLFTLCVSLFTLVGSAVLSWLISMHSVEKTTTTEVQRESFLKEVPVMNKLFEIHELSHWSVIAFIGNRVIREVRITTYLYPDKTFAGQDTAFVDRLVKDTTYYHIPEFIHKKGSYNIVQSDFEYVESHLDALSFTTFIQVKDLLAFVKQHPIVFIEDYENVHNCEWATIEMCNVFEKKMTDILRVYLRRLKKYEMEE